MLHNMKQGLDMATGPSGRIVVEIDPNKKRRLYSVLAEEGLTLKAWFEREAERHIREHQEPSLFSGSKRGSDA